MDVASRVRGQGLHRSRLSIRAPERRRAYLSRTIPLSHPIRNEIIRPKNPTIPRVNVRFNTRHGYNIKRNFGHGSQGLANLLATLNLFAFALHEIQNCACELWRRCGQRAGPRREFFEELRYLTKRECFPNWTVLCEALLEEAPPRPTPGRPRPHRHDAASQPPGHRWAPSGVKGECASPGPPPPPGRCGAARSPRLAFPAAPAPLERPHSDEQNARWFRHTLARTPTIRIAVKGNLSLK